MDDYNVTLDAYGEVINSPGTFVQLASDLAGLGTVVIGWTDQQFTHYDILLVTGPPQYGSLQGGMRAKSDLFVAVRGVGMFGFNIAAGLYFPDYVAEKLDMNQNVTTDALTALINGVIFELGRL